MLLQIINKAVILHHISMLCVCLRQDSVTIERPDTVLLKSPSLSVLARFSTEKSLPHAGQRFQFSQVGAQHHELPVVTET